MFSVDDVDRFGPDRVVGESRVFGGARGRGDGRRLVLWCGEIWGGWDVQWAAGCGGIEINGRNVRDGSNAS